MTPVTNASSFRAFFDELVRQCQAAGCSKQDWLIREIGSTPVTPYRVELHHDHPKSESVRMFIGGDQTEMFGWVAELHTYERSRGL